MKSKKAINRILTLRVWPGWRNGAGSLTYVRPIVGTLLLGWLLLAQSNPVENFDLTGLPPRPTNFMEQRLVDMIERHKPGDVRDAVFIQQKLAEYYREKGDTARARVAEGRARSAEQPAAPSQAGPQSLPSESGRNAPVTGEYVCRSMGSGSCSTQTRLRLEDNGVWGWGRYSGEYQVADGRVSFRGIGGAATWGAAVVGPGTLTFTSGGQKVIWQRPSSAPPSLAGVYFCRTAPGGCRTRHAVELRSDGTWSWGAGRGSYSIVEGRVQFTGTTSGPAGWGPADIGNGVLIFHDRYGLSEWRKE